MIKNIFPKKVLLKPIIKEIEITPEEIALSKHDLPWFSYLKSPSNNETVRYSFIGLSPNIVLQSNRVGKASSKTDIQLVQSNKTFSTNRNIFDTLKEILKTFVIEEIKTDIPFLAGGIGYFGYDLVHYLESLPDVARDNLNIPDSIWVFYDVIYIYDHITSKGYLSAIDIAINSTDNTIHRTKEKIAYWETRLVNDIKAKYNYKLDSFTAKMIKKNISKKDYLESISKIKNYIRKGDIYQANFTYRYLISVICEPFHLFHSLSESHPTPFSAYANFGDFQVMSFSPERFVKCVNRNILVQPMKGTRARMLNMVEDEKQKVELLTDEKESAELIMIVDLLRNDLGKVSNFGSVKVKKIKNLEAYKTVYQLTATITSKLNPQNDLIDLIVALFPSGSITGCPKVRSMEILYNVEKEKRSLFMGSIGYISFHNTLDLNVTIRTTIYKDNNLHFQVGGGIIHDSDPEKEYQETLDKGAFLLNTLYK